MTGEEYQSYIHSLTNQYALNGTHVLTAAMTQEMIRHHLGQIDQILRKLSQLSKQISNDKQMVRAQIRTRFMLVESTRRTATQVSILPRGWGRIADNAVQMGRQQQFEAALAPYVNAEKLLTMAKVQLVELAAALRQKRDGLPKQKREPKPLRRVNTGSSLGKGEVLLMDRSPDLIRESILRLIFQRQQANPNQYVAESAIAATISLPTPESNFHLRVLRDLGLIDLSETMTGSSARLTTRGEQYVREGRGTAAHPPPTAPASGPVINATYATIQNVATNISGNSTMNVSLGSERTADLARLIEQLRSALATSGVEGDALTNAQSDIQALDSEVRRSRPRLGIVKEYVDSLVEIAGPVATTALQLWEIVRTIQG